MKFSSWLCCCSLGNLGSIVLIWTLCNILQECALCASRQPLYDGSHSNNIIFHVFGCSYFPPLLFEPSQAKVLEGKYEMAEKQQLVTRSKKMVN